MSIRSAPYYWLECGACAAVRRRNGRPRGGCAVMVSGDTTCRCGHRLHDHVNTPSLPKPCMKCNCEAFVRAK